MSEDYLPYLNTLRRVPDDIILSVASREINPSDEQSCICGWVVRESIARAVNTDAAEARAPFMEVEEACAARFGGSVFEWTNVYNGICSFYNGGHVERAFVERVLEAVNA